MHTLLYSCCTTAPTFMLNICLVLHPLLRKLIHGNVENSFRIGDIGSNESNRKHTLVFREGWRGTLGHTIQKQRLVGRGKRLKREVGTERVSEITTQSERVQCQVPRPVVCVCVTLLDRALNAA